MQQQTGGYPAATASVTEAIELFRDLGSRYDLAMALNSLGELSSRTSATQEARSRHSQALAIARELGAHLEEARAGRNRPQPSPPGPCRSHRAPPAALEIYQGIGAPGARRVQDTLDDDRR